MSTVANGPVDFLLCSTEISESLELVDLSKYRYSDQGHLSVYDQIGYSVLTNGLSNGYVFDGYVFQDRLYHSRHDRPRGKALTELIENIREASGVFFLGCFNESAGLAWIYGDSLGQYPLFYYNDSSKFAVSNNIQMLRKALESAGIACAPSVENIVFNLSYLSALDTHSAYLGIKILPPRHCIEVSASRGLVVKCLRSLHDAYYSDDSYDQLLERSTNQIRSNCKHIYEFCMENNVFCINDLTAGVDTRMILAGYISNGLQNDVMFYNVNSKKGGSSNDRLVSEMITREFSLRWGDGVGSSAYDTAIVNSPNDYSLGAKISFGVGAYSGLLCDAFANYGSSFLNGFARVGGFFTGYKGKLGPEYTDLVESNAPAQDYVDRYLSRKCMRGRNNFTVAFSDRGYKRALDKLRTIFLGYCQDVDPWLINTVINVENRSRFHFGNRMAVGNRSMVYLTPLLCPSVLPMHSKISHGQSYDGKVAYDLMTSLGGKRLSHFPFGEFRWSRRSMSSSDYKRYRSDVDVIKGTVDTQSEFGSKVYKLSTFFPDRKLTESDAESLIGSRFSTVFDVIEFCIEQIEGDDPLWNYLSREEIVSMVRRRSCNYELVDLGKNLLRFSSMLMLYVEHGALPKLQSEINVRQLGIF